MSQKSQLSPKEYERIGRACIDAAEHIIPSSDEANEFYRIPMIDYSIRSGSMFDVYAAGKGKKPELPEPAGERFVPGDRVTVLDGGWHWAMGSHEGVVHRAEDHRGIVMVRMADAPHNSIWGVLAKHLRPRLAPISGAGATLRLPKGTEIADADRKATDLNHLHPSNDHCECGPAENGYDPKTGICNRCGRKVKPTPAVAPVEQFTHVVVTIPNDTPQSHLDTIAGKVKEWVKNGGPLVVGDLAKFQFASLTPTAEVVVEQTPSLPKTWKLSPGDEVLISSSADTPGALRGTKAVFLNDRGEHRECSTELGNWSFLPKYLEAVIRNPKAFKLKAGDRVLMLEGCDATVRGKRATVLPMRSDDSRRYVDVEVDGMMPPSRRQFRRWRVKIELVAILLPAA